MSTAVKDLGDALEGFLSGCVPDLQLEDGIFHLEKEGAKLHAYCDLVVLAELVRGDTMHQTGLPYAGVPNNDHLEQIVLLLGGSILVREYLVGHLGEDLRRQVLPGDDIALALLCLLLTSARTCFSSPCIVRH